LGYTKLGTDHQSVQSGQSLAPNLSRTERRFPCHRLTLRILSTQIGS